MTTKEFELAREFAAVIRSDLAMSGAKSPAEVKQALVASIATLAAGIEVTVQVKGHDPKAEDRTRR